MYYIYKITNKINGKIYIGQHKHLENEKFDQYMGSGKLIKDAISKYGIDNFTKEILEECTKENVNEREIYWIDKLKARENNYNISAGGGQGDSTLGTQVYNNGKNLKYIKIGDPIPNGYVKGSIKGFHTRKGRLSRSKLLKGQNKNRIPWNKGKHNDNEKVRLNAENAKNTMKITGILKGANNPRAKTFTLIDPLGNKYIVTGELKKFCKEHDISLSLVKKFVNKGKIIIKSNNPHKNFVVLNSIGWEIIIENKNFVEQAKINRIKCHSKLFKEGKLSRKQQNINKILIYEDILRNN